MLLQGKNNDKIQNPLFYEITYSMEVPCCARANRPLDPYQIVQKPRFSCILNSGGQGKKNKSKQN